MSGRKRAEMALTMAALMADPEMAARMMPTPIGSHRKVGKPKKAKAKAKAARQARKRNR